MHALLANGLRLYYEADGAGLPVVFLHGLSGTHDLWKYQVPAVAPHYQAITVDLRGHGPGYHRNLQCVELQPGPETDRDIHSDRQSNSFILFRSDSSKTYPRSHQIIYFLERQDLSIGRS